MAKPSLEFLIATYQRKANQYLQAKRESEKVANDFSYPQDQRQRALNHYERMELAYSITLEFLTMIKQLR